MKHLQDIEDIQATLGTDVPTVLRFIRGGIMPRPMRIGLCLVRWEAEKVIEWVQDGCPACDPPGSHEFTEIRDNLICERISRGDDPAAIDADRVEANGPETFYED